MPDFQRSRNEIVVHPNRSQRSTSTVLYLEPMDSSEPSTANGTLSVEIWRVVRARLHWVVAIIFMGSIAGFVLSLSQTPTYLAKASLEIQNPTETNVQVGDGAAIAPEAYLPTQVAILESRTLRRRAIARLKKENFKAGGVTQDKFSKLRQLLHIAPKTTAVVSVNQALPPITVTAGISINTRIVSISCESTDPRVAAAFANALANEYIDSNLQARWDAINNAREWLAQQLDDSRTKLQKSEDDLQSYGRASNLLFTADKESADQDKLKQLQEELSHATAIRIEKQSAYEMAASTPADAVPQVIDNARLGDYEKTLADLRRQLADLMSMYTPEHPKVKQVQAQINELESTFRKERQDVLTRIRSEYQGALTQERLLSSAYRSQVQIVSDQTQKSVNYNILERDVDTNRKMYDTLLQKAHEADIATAMRGSNTRIIDPAETPVAPAKPNFVWNTLLGSLSGLMIALGFVAVRESLDRSFKSPGDVPQHLNLPELGVIP
jgi:succinoglycan biosynthesis transport protein ExoP